MMTVNPPYTTDAASDDIYYQCANVTLPNARGGAPDAGRDGGGGEVDGGTGSGSNTIPAHD